MRLTRLNDRFSAAERAYVYLIIGWLGAEQHLLLQAAEWFRAAGEVPMNADQLEWRVRAALRIEDWRAVAQAIEHAREPASRDGVDLLAGSCGENAGQRDEARPVCVAMPARRTSMACSLPRSWGASSNRSRSAARAATKMPPGPMPTLVAAGAGAVPARFVHRSGARVELALRERDDRFLLAAAELARRNEIYDRAINTAELARGLSDYELRYLAPYRQIIEPQARQQGPDVSWVYGDAPGEPLHQRGPFRRRRPGPDAGDAGDRQVGRRQARAQGYSLSWLRDPDTNVLIGTNYMRIILEGLDNHPVLASAGYNAGPGRARRWRDTRPPGGRSTRRPFPSTRPATTSRR